MLKKSILVTDLTNFESEVVYGMLLAFMKNRKGKLRSFPWRDFKL